jgi:hypothetical protein
MKRSVAVLLVLGLALGSTSACRRARDEVSPAHAAAELASTSGFATRPNSPVGRRVVEVLAVRRIGRSSIEVEFTWQDYPLPPGQTSPIRASMALFRKGEDGQWRVTSLYKVD